jgi:hypothetical protein
MFFVFTYNGVKYVLTIWVTWRVSYKKQELLTPQEHLGSPRFLVRSVSLIFLVSCVVLCCFGFFFVFVVCIVYRVSLDFHSWLPLRFISLIGSSNHSLVHDLLFNSSTAQEPIRTIKRHLNSQFRLHSSRLYILAPKFRCHLFILASSLWWLSSSLVDN